jgi:hypothetical protein
MNYLLAVWREHLIRAKYALARNEIKEVEAHLARVQEATYAYDLLKEVLNGTIRGK